MDRRAGSFAWVGLLLIVAPGSAAAQPASGGADLVLPGSAVVHVSPVSADTLPILCRDRDRPERGFVTEMSDAEWTPRVGLHLDGAPTAADEVTVRLELDGRSFAASFPAGESGEGYYTAVATVVTADGSAAPRMISFTASCTERLVRGG